MATKKPTPCSSCRGRGNPTRKQTVTVPKSVSVPVAPAPKRKG